MLKFYLPNAISLVRLFGTIALFFITPLEPIFYVIYSVCGISDVLDRSIARWLHAESQFGAKLDSICDILFYAVMLFRIFPVLWEMLPIYVWYIVIAILIVRISAYMVAAFRYHRFSSMHTYLNKITGFVLFCVPYVLHLPIAVGFCLFVCVVAMIASAEELLLHIVEKEYDQAIKSILSFIKKEKNSDAVQKENT